MYHFSPKNGTADDRGVLAPCEQFYIGVASIRYKEELRVGSKCILYTDCHLPPQLQKSRGCKKPSEMLVQIFLKADGASSLRDP